MKRKIILLIIGCLWLGHAFANEEIPTHTVTKSDKGGLCVIAHRYYNQHADTINGYKGENQYIDSLTVWNDLTKVNGNPIITIGQKLYLVNPIIYQKNHRDSHNQVEDNTTLEEVAGQNARTPENTLGTPKDEQSQTNQQTNPQNTDHYNNDDKGGRYGWVWLLLGVLFGAVLGVFLFNVLYVKKQIEEQEYRNTELSRKYRNLNREKSNDNTELSRLRSKIQTLEREKQKLLNENINLGEEIDRLKATQSNTNKNRTTEDYQLQAYQVPNQSSEPLSLLYADAIIDDYFVKVRETPNEDSIFVLQLNGNNSAEFDIYKNAYSKVAANPSYLDGCEKQILYETKQIDIISKGSAQLMGLNGKWKVVKKLNVIIK